MRDGGAGRGWALATNYFGLAALHIVNKNRNVAARTIEMRFHYLQSESCSSARIERIAAPFQYAHGDGRGDPMRGGNGTKRSINFGACGEAVGRNETHAGGTPLSVRA